MYLRLYCGDVIHVAGNLSSTWMTSPFIECYLPAAIEGSGGEMIESTWSVK